MKGTLFGSCKKRQWIIQTEDVFEPTIRDKPDILTPGYGKVSIFACALEAGWNFLEGPFAAKQLLLSFS